jgi:hypothetical protein
MATTDLPAFLIEDEIKVLEALVPLAGQRSIELGCGNARLARTVLERFADSQWVGLEVDARQHAKNLAAPQDRLQFVAAGAQEIPFDTASFDLAVMLKSLHHVPLPLMVEGNRPGRASWRADQQCVDPLHIGRRVVRHATFGQQRLVKQDVRQVVEMHRALELLDQRVFGIDFQHRLHFGRRAGRPA